MELTSDIRSELFDESQATVSKEGTVDVQWQVPLLAALALASRRDVLNFPPGLQSPALACLAGF